MTKVTKEGFDIRTRTEPEGRDPNPLGSYFEKKRYVKELEQRIDAELGKGEGKKLTTAVGAYDRTFFSKFLPKLNGQQTQQLYQNFEQARLKDMAKGNAGKMYAVTIEVDTKFRTAQLDGLKTTLKGRLAEDEVHSGLDPHFLNANPRPSFIIHFDKDKVVLTDSNAEKTLAKLAGDKQTGRNLSAILGLDVFHSLNGAVSQQKHLEFGDPAQRNDTTCDVFLHGDQFVIKFMNDRSTDAIVNIEGGVKSNIPLDRGKSNVKSVVLLRIPAADVREGRVGDLDFAEAPWVSASLYCAPGQRS